MYTLYKNQCFPLDFYKCFQEVQNIKFTERLLNKKYLYIFFVMSLS